MLNSLALIILLGLAGSYLFSKIKVPGLIAMILIGLVIGPFALDLIDVKILNISAELRTIALVIIITRAGFNLKISELRAIARPALLLSFLPASFEIIGTVILAPLLLDLNHLEALVLGTVIAAVSPAIVVPRMILLKAQGYGQKKKIPQMLLASASVDDIFVIVLFSFALLFLQGETISYHLLTKLPLKLILSLLLGGVLALILARFLAKVKIKSSTQVLVLLALSFILLNLEEYLNFSALLALICLSILLNYQRPKLGAKIEAKYQELWQLFEILLFVLIGLALDPSYALKEGLLALALILAVLVFRSLGVLLSLYRSGLSAKERLFVVISFLPKATVQAAIGAIPLGLGLASGQIILTLAVLSIIITGPLAAFAMDNLAERLLEKDD